MILTCVSEDVCRLTSTCCSVTNQLTEEEEEEEVEEEVRGC